MTSMEEIIEEQKKQCIFCKIVNGEILTIKVYEDDLVLAIMDINPAKEGHVLLMPKDHFPLLPWVPRDTFKHLFEIAKYIGRAIEDSLGGKSSIYIANGGAAGQQSTHFMIHVMPEVINPDGNAEIDDAKLEEIKPILKQSISGAIQKVASEDPSIEKFLFVKEEQKENIAELFNNNPKFRELIIKNPDALKEEIEKNPQLKETLKGIDIDALSAKLREMYGGE